MEGNLSWRHALAFLVTLTSAWLIWNGTHLVLTEADIGHSTRLMHVSLATPPAPPAPPKIVPKPPKPVVQRQQTSREPIVPSAHPIGPPVAANAPPSPHPAEATPPAPPSPAVGNATLESTYIASFRAAVEAEKRYPMSKDARLQQPAGTVRLVATLDRSGNLIDVVVAQSAGSILDRAALEAVRRSNFVPFPADIWPGQERHAIQIDLYFHT